MPAYCGVSVDTQMALGDDDDGVWDTLRCGERPRASYTFVHSDRWGRGRASQCGVGHHHRLPAPYGYPQTPHSMQARPHSSDGP